MNEICAHLKKLDDSSRKPVEPSGHGCRDCLERGDQWVHLRLCMTCGQVGCCDSSPNQHATKHAHKSKHPTIKSYEPGEEWAFCYPDSLTVEGFAGLAGESAERHYPAPDPR